MKFKRLISVLLCSIMLFSCSIDALAINLNMNFNGEVVQVPTDTDQFFNISWSKSSYVPNAEQVYVMNMGRSYDMWRYSDNTWKNSFNITTDDGMKKLFDGRRNDITLYLNEQLPQGVKDYLNNGGSWEDIKVTFQCIDESGRPFDPEEIFRDGKVDGWIKWGTEVQLAFSPLFRAQDIDINDNTQMRVRRGLYPYSHTMFSMWGYNRGPHYGATMVTDKDHMEEDENGEKNITPGYDPLYFEHILNTDGDLQGNLRLKNIEYGKNSSFKDFIDSNKARIGDGKTFNNGGAVGISFKFPVKITFEINPIKAKEPNLLYVSEYSIVNMADGADPDEMTTHASMQAYSNRAQLIRFFGSEELYNRVAKMICADNVYSTEVMCAFLDKYEISSL